jgi:PKD repeat protein
MGSAVRDASKPASTVRARLFRSAQGVGLETLAVWMLLLVSAMLLPTAGCVERNLAPIAIFVAGIPVGTSDITVTFDATRSFDDSEIIDYAWDFGDGSPPRTLRGDEGRFPSHTYLVGSKSVTVSLTVVDDDGVSSEPFSLRVVLANQIPTAAFVVASAEGLIVTFDASASSDPDPGSRIGSHTGGSSAMRQVRYPPNTPRSSIDTRPAVSTRSGSRSTMGPKTRPLRSAR